jgi:serine/threonine-protein kinase
LRTLLLRRTIAPYHRSRAQEETIHRDLLASAKEAVAGRYALEREIGRGRYATVFLARDLEHQRAVAVRVLCPTLVRTPGTQRFLRELARLSRLSHPHILPLLDSGEATSESAGTANIVYCVTPFIVGESLRDRLRRDGRLPMDEALRIAHEVSDALSYAHGMNVVHGDLKPENILLEGGRVVVADTGVARAIRALAGETASSADLAAGSPAYMSPEHASGTTPPDGRSDIYSLGCVLYEMLAGTAPFTGPTRPPAPARHVRGGPPSLQALRPDVTPRLQLIIERTLATAPADRYPSAAALSGALAGAHEPLPPSGLKRFRWGRIALAGGILLALAALGMWLAGLGP